MGGWSLAANEVSVPSTCYSCGRMVRCVSGTLDTASDPVRERQFGLEGMNELVS